VSQQVSPDKVTQSAKVMDAYEAEGLLGLCVHLVKVCRRGQVT